MGIITAVGRVRSPADSCYELHWRKVDKDRVAPANILGHSQLTVIIYRVEPSSILRRESFLHFNHAEMKKKRVKNKILTAEPLRKETAVSSLGTDKWRPQVDLPSQVQGSFTLAMRSQLRQLIKFWVLPRLNSQNSCLVIHHDLFSVILAAANQWFRRITPLLVDWIDFKF